MTEEEYLASRINDINKTLSKPFLSRKIRRNQTTALRFYKNELEKVRSINTMNGNIN